MGTDMLQVGFIVNEGLFLLAGGLLLGFGLISENQMSAHLEGNITVNLMLAECPLKSSVANSILIFITFLVSLPGMVMPMTRGWLKLHGYMVVVCAIFTLVLGLDLWFQTLTTRSRLEQVWSEQGPESQSFVQQELSCCGYMNSTSPTFVVDAFCTNAAVAAAQVGCVGPFSARANDFLDIIFTAAFGIVGIDVALVLSVAMLLKERKEKERYRHIDEKNGAGGF